jgi:hypothetical protein
MEIEVEKICHSDFERYGFGLKFPSLERWKGEDKVLKRPIETSLCVRLPMIPGGPSQYGGWRAREQFRFPGTPGGSPAAEHTGTRLVDSLFRANSRKSDTAFPQ